MYFRVSYVDDAKWDFDTCFSLLRAFASSLYMLLFPASSLFQYSLGIIAEIIPKFSLGYSTK